MKRKIKLISDWKKCLKLYSVQVFIALGLLPEIYAGLASLDLIEAMPEALVWTLRAFAVVGLLLRVIKQNNKGADDER